MEDATASGSAVDCAAAAQACILVWNSPTFLWGALFNY